MYVWVRHNIYIYIYIYIWIYVYLYRLYNMYVHVYIYIYIYHNITQDVPQHNTRRSATGASSRVYSIVVEHECVYMFVYMFVFIFAFIFIEKYIACHTSRITCHISYATCRMRTVCHVSRQVIGHYMRRLYLSLLCIITLHASTVCTNFVNADLAHARK